MGGSPLQFAKIEQFTGQKPKPRVRNEVME